MHKDKYYAKVPIRIEEEHKLDKVEVFIKSEATKQVVSYIDDDWPEDDDIPDNTGMYMWSDGNYACDCNRFLFFERALGNEPDWNDGKCGTEGYSVNIKRNDEFLIQEFEED